jgi:hypothetical protein
MKALDECWTRQKEYIELIIKAALNGEALLADEFSRDVPWWDVEFVDHLDRLSFALWRVDFARFSMVDVFYCPQFLSTCLRPSLHCFACLDSLAVRSRW